MGSQSHARVVGALVVCMTDLYGGTLGGARERGPRWCAQQAGTQGDVQVGRHEHDVRVDLGDSAHASLVSRGVHKVK